MDLTIRSADTNDSELVILFINKLLSELSEQPILMQKRKAENAFNLCCKNENVVFLAFQNDQACGLITIVKSLAIYTEGYYGVINEFYISPEFRSAGIGSALLKKAKEHAIKHNWSRLEVGAPNAEKWQRTIDFYKHKGFCQVGPKLKIQL